MVSKFELEWKGDQRGFDYVVDGRLLREHIRVLNVSLQDPFLREQFGHLAERCAELSERAIKVGGSCLRLDFVTGLNARSSEVLSELLLEKPPSREDGRIPVIECCHDSMCQRLVVRIEREQGLILWKDFQFALGVPDFQVEIAVGPFYFEEKEYLETLEWARRELRALEIQTKGRNK